MAPPRTRSGRDKRKIDELTSENEELRARQQRLDAQSQAHDNEIARLRAQLQQLQGGNGDMEVVEDEPSIEVLSDGDQGSINDTSNPNNNSDEDGYHSTGAITGIDGERLDRGVNDHDIEESDEEEQNLINNINQNINGDAEEAEGNGAAEQEDEIGSDEEDDEETVEYQPPQAFEPDLKTYAGLSENDKACKANCPKLVLALLAVTKDDEAYAQYCLEGFGVDWRSFLEEKYQGCEVGKRAGVPGDALSDLYVGVWRERGSELPGRRNHVGLIWRDGSGRICIFDPFNINSCYDAPKIIVDPRPRKMATVDLMTGVYPPGTPMVEQADEVVDLT